jgi:precorrin-6A/cobalt-precorrin-6A reductase
LAGRTHRPTVPEGAVRIGGFGGTAGLIQYLQAERIEILIDATHPFAAQMSWQAAAAAAVVKIPFLMLVRPPWTAVAGDRWITVETIAAAAQAIPPPASRVFLTIGRQHIAPFAALSQTWFLIRSIDPPASTERLPPGKILLDRGPFTLESERQLLRDYRINAIVSKNSGGSATYAKIIAARELGIPVVMVQRPTMPAENQVPDVDAAMAWLLSRLEPSTR